MRKLRPDTLKWGPAEAVGPGIAEGVRRFFSDSAAARELALVSSEAGTSGIIISSYKPSGVLRTGEHS